MGFFRYFKEYGCEIAEFGKGIYHVQGKTWFPTQIVVTGELDRASHIWVKGLSNNLSKEDFREMLDERNKMTEKEDRELREKVVFKKGIAVSTLRDFGHKEEEIRL